MKNKIALAWILAITLIGNLFVLFFILKTKELSTGAVISIWWLIIMGTVASIVASADLASKLEIESKNDIKG